jgi:hypothetical protein
MDEKSQAQRISAKILENRPLDLDASANYCKDARGPNQVKINASSPNAELSTISLTVLRTVWYEILHSAEKLALRAKFAKNIPQGLKQSFSTAC